MEFFYLSITNYCYIILKQGKNGTSLCRIYWSYVVNDFI